MKTHYSSDTLKNRMRLFTVPIAGTDAVTLFIFCKVGSRQEPSALNGASHFLEHLMFKGTKKRPSTLVISQELESMGAEFNAYTSKDHTAYYIKTQSAHLERALDIMSDMLFRSVFQPKEIERERKVIIEEIKMYEENPMMHIEDLAEQTLFTGSLGRSIAGPAKIIASVSRKKMLEYKKLFYQPANMVCVVSGKLPDNVKSQVNKYFGSHAGSRTTFPAITPAGVKHRVLKIQKKKTKQTQIAIMYPGYSHNHPDMPALELLTTILGGSMSSRLFINVRERRGLCYFIKSDIAPYEDTGALGIFTGVAVSRLNEAVQSIDREIAKIKRQPVALSELKRAKEYIKGKLILRMESSEKVAQWFGQEALFMKKVERPEDRVREIDSVTVKDIMRVAKELLDPTKRVVAAVGPFTPKRLKALFGLNNG